MARAPHSKQPCFFIFLSTGLLIAGDAIKALIAVNSVTQQQTGADVFAMVSHIFKLTSALITIIAVISLAPNLTGIVGWTRQLKKWVMQGDEVPIPWPLKPMYDYVTEPLKDAK